MQLTPFSVINFIRWIIVSLIIYACYSYIHGIENLNLFSGGTYIAQLLRSEFNVRVNFSPGVIALIAGLWITIWLRIFYRVTVYLENVWMAIYVFFIERKRIIKMPFYKKVLYSLTWPTFDIIGRYTQYVALFKKIEWKPIPHESKVTIEDLQK